jgi:N-acetylglucosaminyl-diphospho-decaprenol L-rhamnosyltransferase
MKNTKDITIIIVTYKSSHIISQTLDKIINKGFRIIIVDNDSNDGIEELLLQEYKNSGLELILLKHNCGFGKANNIALEKTTTKYAFILNPDTIIAAESIEHLVKIADIDKKIALANPHLVNKEDYDNQHKIVKKEDKIIESDVLCGGCLLMRMSIFKKIGFFDKKLFLYGEDIEISDRALEHKYKIVTVLGSYAHHMNQKSTKINNKIEYYKLLYFRYWHQGWAKTYLKKRNRHVFRIWLKLLHRFISAMLYFLKLDLENSIMRFALSFGSFSCLCGIDCFNKTNKIAEIKRQLII